MHEVSVWAQILETVSNFLKILLEATWTQDALVGLVILALLGFMKFKNRFGVPGTRKNQSIKLTISPNHLLVIGTILQDMESISSENHSHSPFYVWERHADYKIPYSQYRGEHLRTTRRWLFSQKSALESDTKYLDRRFFSGLCEATSELAMLGEQAERSLQHVLQSDLIDESKKRDLKKDWDLAKTRFNEWASRLSFLHKELKQLNPDLSQAYIATLKAIA